MVNGIQRDKDINGLPRETAIGMGREMVNHISKKGRETTEHELNPQRRYIIYAKKAEKTRQHALNPQRVNRSCWSNVPSTGCFTYRHVLWPPRHRCLATIVQSLWATLSTTESRNHGCAASTTLVRTTISTRWIPRPTKVAGGPLDYLRSTPGDDNSPV